MKINYCLPIIKNSKKEVLDTIAKYRNEYQYIEVWLNPIIDLDNQFINKITYMLQDKLIILFSRGKKMQNNNLHERKLSLLDLLDGEKSFLDLDISEEDELTYLRKKQLKIRTIISYHNYKETPVNLSEIIKEIDIYHPTIYKIATMCENETDALKLLLLQQNLRTQNKKHIVLGMGEFGTITRVYATLWGNELIYAPKLSSEQSALGQLTKNQLENIFKQLNSKHEIRNSK